LGERRGGKKKKIRAGRMGFSFIRKMASTGSSATGALVAANSLQPLHNHLPSCSWVYPKCRESHGPVHPWLRGGFLLVYDTLH